MSDYLPLHLLAISNYIPLHLLAIANYLPLHLLAMLLMILIDDIKICI